MEEIGNIITKLSSCQTPGSGDVTGNTHFFCEFLFKFLLLLLLDLQTAQLQGIWRLSMEHTG